MDRQYRVQEFAALTGVTPKALRHYDRIGLLKPRRNASGYRVYAERDPERLEQIAALTFIGFPLRDVRRLLEGRAPSLADALRAQRAVLEEKRRLLDLAAETIRRTECLLASGHVPDAAVLKRLIEVVDMQRHVETLKKYFSREAWANLTRARDPHASGASSRSDEWRALLREAESLKGEDPAGKKCQEFGDRWARLWERTTGGDAAVLAGIRTAWADRANWPPQMRDLAVELDTREAGELVRKSLVASMKRYYTEDAWARKAALDRPETNAAWARLYEEARALVGEDPAGEKGRDLATRWCQLWDASTGQDPEVQSGMRRAWEDRQRWPVAVQRYADDSGIPAAVEWIGKAIRELHRTNQAKERSATESTEVTDRDLGGDI